MTEFINGIELPRYVSHKEVQALEIGKIIVPGRNAAECGAMVWFKDERFGSLECEVSMFARFVPDAGDYLVFYADGYKSFSPRAAFEQGYSVKA